MKEYRIEEKAKEILKDFPIIEKLPASLSGHYHVGETHRQHVELTANIMRHLCDEFNINKADRDMLIATAYLHDIGIYVITQKGKVNKPGWKYHKTTRYSRLESLMRIHPIIGASILEDYKIERKGEIKRLISVHMSHWYKMTPQPKNLYEQLICVADYIASRGKRIFKYETR